MTDINKRITKNYNGESYVEYTILVNGQYKGHNPHGPAYRSPKGDTYWLNGKTQNIVGPAWGLDEIRYKINGQLLR